MKSKKLVTSAMLIALAAILSFIKILTLPFGGSVTLLSMLPVVLISYMYGVPHGLCCSFAYCIISAVTDMHLIGAFFLPGENHLALPAAIGVCIFDYVLAYTSLGFGGIFRGKFKSKSVELVLGCIVALGLRYIMHTISGTLFFGAWASWFFSDTTGLSQIAVFKPFCMWVIENVTGGKLAMFYSLIYNGAYMIPEIILTSFAAPIIYKISAKNNLIK